MGALAACGGKSRTAGSSATNSSKSVSALTRAEYQSRLHAASVELTAAEESLIAGVQNPAVKASEVAARLRTWGHAESKYGKQFGALVPPPAAAKANADLSRAEVLYGTELLAIAAKVPKKKSDVNGYLQGLKSPSGSSRLSAALLELHKAGFKTGT